MPRSRSLEAVKKQIGSVPNLFRIVAVSPLPSRGTWA